MQIPKERSCADAYIEPHWCTCLDWQNLSLNDPIIKRLEETLLKTLNDYTNAYRPICAQLSLAQMTYVTKLQPNQDLVKFNKNADFDGFVADLSAKTKLNTNMYQIKATLMPGNSIFEASITHNLDKNVFELKISDISRINLYGKQARCVEKNLPHLRKYCYCLVD